MAKTTEPNISYSCKHRYKPRSSSFMLCVVDSFRYSVIFVHKTAKLPTLLHSAESFRIWTLYSASRVHLKILRNQKFYRIGLASHQMDVIALIQGMLSLLKDELWAPSCCILLVAVSQGQRERDWDRRQRDEWNQGEGDVPSLWKLFRKNTQTFLNVILCHIRGDSGFSSWFQTTC